MTFRDRLLVAALGAALVVFSIAALAPTLQSAGEAVEPTPPAAEARGYVEGVLGQATNSSPFGARSAADRALVALQFRGLVHLGPGGTLIPDLALRWDVTDAGQTWTFHLRPGLLWQDGDPLTAEDVAFTMSVLADPLYTGPGAESWGQVETTVIDPLTVAFRLTTPLGGFLQAATQPIAPAHLLGGVPTEALADHPFGQLPVGSGPFRMVFLSPSRALLEPATAPEVLPDDPGGPNFTTPQPTDSLAEPAPTARPDLAVPYLSSLELRWYDDLDALAADWAGGDLDAVSGVPLGELADLARGDGRIVRYPGTTLLAAALDLRPSRPEFRDPVVRRALLQAIDRDAIVASVLGGVGARADSLIPPGSTMFSREASPEVAFDVAAARKALETAGWKRGSGSWTPKGASEPLVIELLSPEELANPVAYAVAARVADAWKSLGLSVRHLPLPAGELIGQRLSLGKFQVAVIPLAIGLDPDPYPLLASSQTRTGGTNVIGLQDPELDELLVAARTPVDETTRVAAYRNLQERLSVQTYVLPIAALDEYTLFADRVIGPESRSVGASGDRYWDVLIWRLADGS